MVQPKIVALEKEIELLKKENLSLKFEREEFRTIFMISKNGIALLDLDSNFISVNPAYIEMSGYTENELLKLSCIGLSIDEDIPRSIAIIKEVIKVGYVRNYEKTCVVKSGKLVTVNMSLALLPDKKTILINTIDITKIRKLQVDLYQKKEILKKQAFYDYLTQVPNRMLFNEELDKAIAKTQHNDKKFALLFIDLDNFKMVNDNYGHNVGDEVLIYVADKINKEVSSNNTFARIGGDEFAIIFNDYSDKNQVENLVKNIIMRLEDMKIFKQYKMNISASIGITFCPEDNIDAQELLHNADVAMYQAKNDTHKKYIFHKEIAR